MIETFSTGYFALLREKPALKTILALGDRVVFQDGERIVHVRPVEKKPVEKKAGEGQPKKEAVPPAAGEAKKTPVIR